MYGDVWNDGTFELTDDLDSLLAEHQPRPYHPLPFLTDSTLIGGQSWQKLRDDTMSSFKDHSVELMAVYVNARVSRVMRLTGEEMQTLKRLID